MKNYMPLDGLRCSRDSGSAHCDTPKSAVLGRPGGGGILPTQLFKYPPRIYYLSYAISVFLILWILKDKVVFIINEISPKVLGCIAYIGSRTIWIYLWHIVVLGFVGNIDYTVVRFLVVYGIAIGITFLQVKIVESITENISNISLKKNIRMVFIG